MRVWIDAAWYHEFAGCVDFLVRFDHQILADEGYCGAVDEDVGVIVVDCGDDTSVLDQNTHFRAPPAFDRPRF